MARDSIRCSFCGKRQEQVGRIIAGPNVYICNECVELCSSILRDEMHNGVNTQQLELPDTLPTPEQIKSYDFSLSRSLEKFLNRLTGRTTKTQKEAAENE